MYLKKIDVFGFKSFANKTELVFEPGVTAVVGPNGCGKSNISDAIKWVLGEQSAKELRGSKMEDVIFNGTADTQPVNLAEVSLTLSNKDHVLPVDYEEVIITRRVFRSGESEYLLNKTHVRLKDITELLAGTGIGVSSYSISEQGKMDRVINARPEDRRDIFEEASGITRYKKKKKEALLKLEHTENNLMRLADIINEVKRQIGSIERQAQKAEKFRAEFDKLKELDVRLALREYKNIKDKGDKAKGENEALRQREGHLSLELNVQMDELRLHREKISALDEKIADVRMKTSKIAGDIDKNENTIRLDRERIEELTSRSHALSREIEEITRRSAELREKVAKVESEFGLINDEKQKRQALLTEAEEGLKNIAETVNRCKKTISESKASTMDNISQQSKIRNELNKVAASLGTMSSRRRRLNIEKENVAKEAESIEQRIEKAESLYTQQKVILNNIMEHLDSTRSDFDKINKDIDERSRAIEARRQALASSTSKLELLKDLRERKEGFSEGVKAYMEFIDMDPEAKESFIGVIADMLRPQKGFVVPLECSLGEKSQAIVVRDRKAVDEALGYLKRSNKARAQFIAINELPATTDIESDFEPPSSVRLSQFVDIRDEYRPLLQYILKGIYLVEDISKASQVKGPDAVFVTKTGDMVQGLFTSGGGDAKDEYSSVIGRDARIKELSDKVEILVRDISAYEAERSDLTQRQLGLGKELAAAEDAAKQEEIKLNARESEKAKVAEDGHKLRQELDLINLELNEIAEEESGLKNRENAFKENLSELEAEHGGLEALISESQNTMAAKSAEREKVIVKLTELRTEMSLVSEKYNSQNAALNMLKDSLRDEESAGVSRNSQISEAREKKGLLGIEIERIVKENSVLAEQRNIVDGELAKLQEEKKSNLTVAERIDAKTHDSQKDLDELRSKISSFHVSMTELSYKANSIRERIQQLYKIDIDEASAVFTGDEDWDAVKSEVERLRDKVEKLGPVNLVAIEEHKELQDRYDFLTNQQEDLVAAKELLHKAINRINRTTRKMFIDTFEQIRAAFKDYFKLLFGGGGAELFLMDQADILETGIEIAVRPPGKKLQNISLLSGGEKALTAIALLFALFKVRPTPFCILDEIDAPLDEINIDRFSRMLSEFISTTQFIVITHNKKTMAICDIMYGITMEKSGISKIVSVKFADDQKPVKAQRKQKMFPSRPKPVLPEAPPENSNPAESVADESSL